MSSLGEHDRVVLVTDLPGEKLAVEFVALDGETVAVVMLDGTQVRAVQHREITHARRVA